MRNEFLTSSISPYQEIGSDALQSVSGGFIPVVIVLGALMLSCAHSKGCQPRDDPQYPE